MKTRIASSVMQLPFFFTVTRASSSSCSTSSASAVIATGLRSLMRSTAQPVAVISVTIPLPNSSSSSPSPTAPNHGATLSSLSSISLSPPLISFSLRLPSRLATYLLAATNTSPKLRVHLLSDKQEHLARVFARQEPLPSKAAPSPSPSNSKSTETEQTVFSPGMFEELERGSLGTMDCRIVHSIPLSGFGAEKEKENGPRSELFIAQVEGVVLPEKEKGKGSLVWYDQSYHVVGGK